MTSSDHTKSADYRTAWQEFYKPSADEPDAKQGKLPSTKVKKNQPRIKFQSPNQNKSPDRRVVDKRRNGGYRCEISPCRVVLEQGKARMNAVDNKLSKLRGFISGIRADMNTSPVKAKKKNGQTPRSSPRMGKPSNDPVTKSSPNCGAMNRQKSPRKSNATSSPSLKRSQNHPSAQSKSNIKTKQGRRTNTPSPRKLSPSKPTPKEYQSSPRSRPNLKKVSASRKGGPNNLSPRRGTLARVKDTETAECSLRAKVAVRSRPDERSNCRDCWPKTSPAHQRKSKPAAGEDDLHNPDELCRQRQSKTKTIPTKTHPKGTNHNTEDTQQISQYTADESCQCSECLPERRQPAAGEDVIDRSTQHDGEESELDTADQSVMISGSLVPDSPDLRNTPVYKDSWCQWEAEDLPSTQRPSYYETDDGEVYTEGDVPQSRQSPRSRRDLFRSSRRSSGRPDMYQVSRSHREISRDYRDLDADNDYGKDDCQVMMLTSDSPGHCHGMGDCVWQVKRPANQKLGRYEQDL